MYAEFDSHDQLRTNFGHHLAIELNKPKYLWIVKPDATIEPRDPDLSDDEKRLLIAAASDINGQVLTGTTLGGFFVQANSENFVEDTPRSVAAWKRALRRLEEMRYIDPLSDELYELTEEGFERADKEIGLSPLSLSLSFAGTPDNQTLSANSSKPIKITRLDLLTSSEATVTSLALDAVPRAESLIPLDHKKIVELFNAPRPDKNHYDHSGPAAIRVVFTIAGRHKDVVLPVMLQPTIVSDTRWIRLLGSKIFTIE